MTRDSAWRGARPTGLPLPRDPAAVASLIIIAGMLLRVLFGGVLLPLSGLGNDIAAFTAWAQRLAEVGPGEFYETGYFSDYPPGYLYVLWLLGAIGQVLQQLTGGIDITPGLVKVPGVLADAGVAWILFIFSRRFLDGWLAGWSGARIGLVAAAIYIFNPATIFDSAIWGQVDSVGTLVLLLTLYFLARGWTEASAVAAVAAMLIKFQFALLIPVVAIVGLKRHALGRSSDPLHHGRPDGLRVLTSLAAGFGTLVLGILPFNMALYTPLAGGDPRGLLGILPDADPVRSLVGKFTEAADTYHGLTINAFNLWRNPWSELGDTITWGCDSPAQNCVEGAGVALSVGSTLITWQAVGAVLFGVVALIALWQVARRDDPAGLLDGSLLLAVAFFALPTRVHERYLFPAIALAAPLVARGGRWVLVYAVLTVSLFTNMYWVYTADWSFVRDMVINPGVDGQPMVREPILGGTVFTDWGIYALSFMVVLLTAALAVRSARLAWTAQPLPEPPAWTDVAAPARTVPAVSGLQPEDQPGWLTRFRLWLRPDPADPYLREPMRRLDRLDLLLVIGLVVFAFAFRLWRLDTPRSMHFDEVYHARSATEWLANWQEGWTRDTYEWTHPHLAKYLIAAGIVVADPNKVVASASVDQPITAMAVAPQRTQRNRPASLAFTAAGRTITARDVMSGQVVSSWVAPGMVASLAYDEDAERLLVGTADDGEVLAYDISTFVTQNGERAPPPEGSPIATDLGGVSQIEIPFEQNVILFRGPDGIVAVERVTGAELGRSELRAGGVGYLPGVEDDDPLVVATDLERGVLAVLDGGTLRPVRSGGGNRTEPLPSAPVGPLQVRGRGEDAQVYVPVGALPASVEHPAVDGGITVFDHRANPIDTAPLPGSPRIIGWQLVANIIYVAGIDSSSGEPAAWTVQPIGNGDPQSAGFAAFDTTPLPGEPLALALDLSDHRQDDDHARLLVTTAGAPGGPQLVQIDAGSNAFAWRLSGIVFGSILVGLIYLLAATMFSRRRIAVLAAAFVAVDGMSYVMSRISMNDIFVATFIAAAYLVFWQAWSGRWSRSAWWALPLVGVFIGLAAATKWVGIYALAGMWVLVLARSHLGRFVLVAGVAFLTVVAGIGAPWPFLVVCLVGLAVALLIVWLRPIRLEPEDLLAIAPVGLVLSGVGLAFVLAFNQVQGGSPEGAVEVAFSVLARGAQVGWPALLMLGIAAVLLVARAAWSLARPQSDACWYVPGEMAGFAWPWVGACLAVIPLAMYFLSYVPYLQLGHPIAGAEAGPGYGWALDELHAQMFGYHFGLQPGHPASSPWWSWPLDLKPVWFYGHDFDGRTIGVIYNGGNPILFWAGVPAIVLCGLLAWKRRSLALVLLVVAFAFQYLPWTRIERATFHYHYFTALLFAMVAVAYLVDEGLRSWSWRPLAMAFLVVTAIAGVLVFPMGSALAMPDWYINTARALPPWNYGFQFPDPPQGDRGELLAADLTKLMVGTVLAVLAAAFALFGRDRLSARPPAAPRGPRPEPDFSVE
ncbi:MAG TPA: phospholipid carrier-dependent glycosyltransferase [Candidatus Limnocylindria bacterium]|nr:phospholipid carrier-dependent glycosyltransferase [Candidatus Limnocylindria bacterium]